MQCSLSEKKTLMTINEIIMLIVVVAPFGWPRFCNIADGMLALMRRIDIAASK
jgi:hypothetical protein